MLNSILVTQLRKKQGEYAIAKTPEKTQWRPINQHQLKHTLVVAEIYKALHLNKV